MLVAVSPYMRFADSFGHALVGGKVYTYQTRSSVGATTWASVDGTTVNTNPIALDANGGATIFLPADLAYRFEVRDASGTPIRIIDDITGAATPADVRAAATGMMTASGPVAVVVTNFISVGDVGRVVYVSGGSCVLPGVANGIDGRTLLIVGESATTLSGAIKPPTGLAATTYAMSAGETLLLVADAANNRWAIALRGKP